MANPCKYQKVLGCSECVHPFHRECKKFLVARAKEISVELNPFIYTSKVKVTHRVMWSRDENKAKSIALKYALKRNTKIRKYTLAQVISLALSNEPVESDVVYIEYSSKLAGDVDKLKGVLTSFVDSVMLRGGCVSLYVAPSLVFNVDYDKV